MSAHSLAILGLTGDIACGKSTVARLLLQKFGVPHIDADLLVRELYSQPAFAEQIAAEFGDVLDVSGAVDRARLGAVVFGNAPHLKRLEALVHPAVAALRSQKLSELEQAGADTVVVEAVKLLESGQGENCSEIWCVVAAPDIQRQRLIEHRGLSAEEARLRLESQPSRTDKLQLAKNTPLVWIENDGSLTELEATIELHWERFRRTFVDNCDS